MQGKRIGNDTNQSVAVKPPVAKKPQPFRKSEGLGKVPLKDPPLTNSSLNKAPREEQNHISKGLPPMNSTSSKTLREEQSPALDGQKSWISAGPGQNVGKNISEQKVCLKNDMPDII